MGCLPMVSKIHNFRAVFVGTCWHSLEEEEEEEEGAYFSY